jgi:hypothetical protein
LASVVARGCDAACVTLPGLVLLGAPKCGTTTLAAWWDLQPQGFTAPEKEVGFFTAEWDRGLDWYRSRFACATRGQVTCDASPGYLYDDVALDRLARELPHARLAVILREPVSRVWSHWCYMTALGLEPRPFSRVLDEEALDPTATPPAFPIGYLQGSRYASRLEAVTQRFERSQLLVLLTDELRDDPVGTFARLCRHGGIAPGTPGGRENEGRLPRSMALQRTLGRFHAYGWPGGVGRRLMQLNLRPGSPPPLGGADRERLRGLLVDEVPALRAWLGRDLPASWG